MRWFSGDRKGSPLPWFDVLLIFPAREMLHVACGNASCTMVRIMFSFRERFILFLSPTDGFDFSFVRSRTIRARLLVFGRSEPLPYIGCVRSSVAVPVVRGGRFPPMGWHIGTAPTDGFGFSYIRSRMVCA